MSNGKILYIDQTLVDSCNSVDTLLYPLKESEAQVLLSQVEYIAWRKRWKNLTYSDDEINELYATITDNLMNPQESIPEGAFIVTAQELCEAVECGIINVFSRAVAGTAGNTGVQVTFDENGNPVITEGELSTGTGATVTGFRQRMADMEYVELRLEDFLNDFDDFYLITSGDVVVMEQFFTAKYLLNANITAVISEYTAFRDALNPHVQSTFTNIDREMYCKGAKKQTVSTWIIYDALGDKTLRLNMIGALTDDQFLQWESEADSLSDDYISTSCFRAPQVTMIFPPEKVVIGLKDTNNPPELVLFSNTRANIRISGKIIGDNGDFYDGIYNQVNGNKAIRLPQITTGSKISPNPAYSENGYELIWSIGVGISKIRFDSGVGTVQNYTGQLTFVFDDIGIIE